ncbi:M14 family metallopeptidase [Adlercreutzia sp. ZJ473]|uniref:M14 family metallopeptidase n=1 Tax=Adlercreutzia sp. ZJ473 TaxID=2722822 RepID=UPI00155627F9|nr:M14 family metallopeptidase [Adlercreutzia sp. ZJ473]
MVETVFSAELPVREHLLVQKNRIIGADLAREAGVAPGEPSASAVRPELLEAAPRMAVVTGIHGDELEGQHVAFELARILRAHLDQVHGIIDIYPAINPLGINSIERGVPGYDLDLNRVFPGDAAGSLTEALAAAVIDDIRGAQVCVDIHASNIFLREMPQVRINEESSVELLPLSHLINIDFVWVHASATVLASTLAYSLNSIGTKTLVVETGVGMRITPHETARLTHGMLRLANHFGIWSGEFGRYGMPMVSGDHRVSFLNANAAGVFLPRAAHGKRVGKGELIGVIVDPLEGVVREEVRCPVNGLLFTLREYPVVYPGSLLARVLGGE